MTVLLIFDNDLGRDLRTFWNPPGLDPCISSYSPSDRIGLAINDSSEAPGKETAAVQLIMQFILFS